MASVPPIMLEVQADVKSLQVGINTAIEKLNALDGATKKAGNSTKEMSAKTVASGVVIGQAVTALGKKALEFSKEFVTAFTDVAGEVRKLQRVLGGTPEDMSRLRFAAEEVGVSVDTLGRGMRILSVHLLKNDAQAKQLGISYRDANGHLLPSTEILKNLSDKFSRMPNGLGKTALAVQAFGRSATELLPLLNLGGKGLEEMYKNADKLGLTMSGKDLAAAKDYTIKQRELHAAIQGVQLSIGRDLVPAMTKMIDYIIANVIPNIQALVNGLMGKDGLSGAFSSSARQAYAWGKFIHDVFAEMFKYKNVLLVIAGILATMWLATKIEAGISAVVAGIGLITAAWVAVATAAGTAAVAEDVASGGTIGIAQIAAAGAALAIVTGIAAKVKGAMNNISADLNLAPKPGEPGFIGPVAFDPNALPLYIAPPDTFGTDASVGAAKAKAKKHAVDIVAAYIDSMKQARTKLDAQFAIDKAKAKTPQQEIVLGKTYLSDVSKLLTEAKAEEIKTRGTKNHAKALSLLTAEMKDYAKALAYVDKGNKDAARLEKSKADAIAAATAALNAQLAAMANSQTAANSWLAAQTRASGPTAAQFTGSINIPVIIDGQTVFRATQKASLLNDRRNPTNGQSISGSLI